MNGVSPDNLLLIGKIIRPHGLEGCLRILSYAESEKTFLDAGTVIIRPEKGDTYEHKVISLKPHHRIFLLKLEGVDTPDAAEAYRDAAIFIQKRSISREEEASFFWYELIGLSVFLDTGEYVGTIRHILPTGSNDVYVVKKGRTEILVPAIHDVVKEIDLKHQEMIITNMGGLLNLNEV